MNRVTRSASHRKPTEKYRQYQHSSTSRKDKNSERSPSSIHRAEEYSLLLRSQTSGNAPNHTPKKQKKATKSVNGGEATQIEHPTSNSTPDKADAKKQQPANSSSEQVNAPKTKFVKSSWQNLEMQKQSSSTTKTALVLMPKRIMSSKKERAAKKEAEKKPVEAPIKKPKDRSNLVGLKRTRKSRDQICKL